MSAWTMLIGYGLFVLLQDIYQPSSQKLLQNMFHAVKRKILKESSPIMDESTSESLPLQWHIIARHLLLLFALPSICFIALYLLDGISPLLRFLVETGVLWFLIVPMYNWTDGQRLYRALCVDDLETARSIVLLDEDQPPMAESLIKKGIHLVSTHTESSVICPLFYAGFLGVPGMLCYIMLNAIASDLQESSGCSKFIRTSIAMAHHVATSIVMYPFSLAVFVVARFMFPNHQTSISMLTAYKQRSCDPSARTRTQVLCTRVLNITLDSEEDRGMRALEKEDIIRMNDLLFLSSTLLLVLLFVLRSILGIWFALAFVILLSICIIQILWTGSETTE